MLHCLTWKCKLCWGCSREVVLGYGDHQWVWFKCLMVDLGVRDGYTSLYTHALYCRWVNEWREDRTLMHENCIRPCQLPLRESYEIFKSHVEMNFSKLTVSPFLTITPPLALFSGSVSVLYLARRRSSSRISCSMSVLFYFRSLV